MPVLNKANQAEYEELDRFLRSHPNGWFTQSLCWPEVKQEESEVLYIRNGARNISAAAIVLVKRVPCVNRSFLYLPRGPVLDWSDGESVASLLEELDQLACKRHAYKIVLDPQIRLENEAALRLLNYLVLCRKRLPRCSRAFLCAPSGGEEHGGAGCLLPPQMAL